MKIGDHAADDLELLPVLFPEKGEIGADLAEKLRAHRRDAAEVPWPCKAPIVGTSANPRPRARSRAQAARRSSTVRAIRIAAECGRARLYSQAERGACLAARSSHVRQYFPKIPIFAFSRPRMQQKKR